MIERGDVKYKIGKTGYWEAVPLHRKVVAKNARIAWDLDEECRKVVAVGVTDDPEEWVIFRALRMSGGACFSDWFVPVKQRRRPPNSVTPDPAGTFGILLSRGFASNEVLREALIQFARIDDCAWARRMLFAVDGELSEKDLASK